MKNPASRWESKVKLRSGDGHRLTDANLDTLRHIKPTIGTFLGAQHGSGDTVNFIRQQRTRVVDCFAEAFDTPMIDVSRASVNTFGQLRRRIAAGKDRIKVILDEAFSEQEISPDLRDKLQGLYYKFADTMEKSMAPPPLKSQPPPRGS